MGEFFVYSFFFGALFFFFPVFAGVDAYVDPVENRAWFSVNAYKFIKIFGGYGEIDKEGIAVHLSKKKAVFVAFDKMGDTRKKFEITQGFQLWKFRQVIETGSVNSPYSVLLTSAIQAVSGGVFSYLKTRYPFLTLRNSVLLREEPCLKITLQTSVVFNGLVLSIALSKKLLEGFINWIRKRKSIRYSKRQPSN